MNFELPIKCGEMYIKFNREHKPEYGFIVKGNIIKTFVNLTDNLPQNIVLPYINQNAFVPTCQKQMDIAKQLTAGENYVKGNIKIAQGCFQGLKSVNIVVPFNSSIMLYSKCFEEKAEVEMTVPTNMELKQVIRSFVTSMDYERESWTLLADKDIDIDIKTSYNSFTSKKYTEYDCNLGIKYIINNNIQLDSNEDLCDSLYKDN